MSLINDNTTAQKLKPFIARNYKYTIQEPMHIHRDEVAGKFENRIDYVDISAYGVGKVKVDTKKNNRKKNLLRTTSMATSICQSDNTDSEVSEIDEDASNQLTLKKIMGF